MNNLIDKAVLDHSGKFPTNPDNVVFGYDYHFISGGLNQSGFMRNLVLSDGSWLNSVQFGERAKELGFINGYKWGVEYETNGKKPNLPDHLLMETYFDDEWHPPYEFYSMNWNFDTASYPVVKFRICDERYKPAEAEQVQADWYDYDKQQAIGLPPVGVECAIWELDEVWRKCEVVAHTKKGLVVEWQNKEFLVASDRKFRPIDYNRKAESVTRFEYNSERPDEQHVARFTLMPDQYAELIIKNKAAL